MCAAVDELLEIVLRHALAEGAIRGLVGAQRDLRGQPHQFELVGVLHAPTTSGDRRPADDLQARRGRREAVAEDEAHRLLDADASAREAAIAQALRDALVRILVLFPGPDVGGSRKRSARHLLARAILLERRTDDEGLTLDRHDHRQQPFGNAPADVAEVDERRPAGQQDRVQLLRGHQAAGLLDPRAPLVHGDRPGLIAHRRQGCKTVGGLSGAASCVRRGDRLGAPPWNRRRAAAENRADAESQARRASGSAPLQQRSRRACRRARRAESVARAGCPPFARPAWPWFRPCPAGVSCPTENRSRRRRILPSHSSGPSARGLPAPLRQAPDEQP